MENKNNVLTDILPDQAIFALDIGTRSIIGMVGVPDGDRIHVVAIEKAEHTKRAMIDGQIEDIDQVAKIAGLVKDKLEKKLGCRLTKVCVSAAGRALRTESVTHEMELPKAQKIDAEAVSRLEAGAISEAENMFMEKEGKDSDRQFYLVGYTVCKYYLDNYIISNLIDHHGRVLKADIIATFLPTEVVESLYSAMHKIDLEVASLTLEPIAAINAAIPQNIRLLNLAMVDIGAGTSDIAVCRDGSVTGYTMAILAGDEITETIMREYLVDFDTAEKIKSEIDETDQLHFMDILGFEQTITKDTIFESIKQASSRLCEEISAKILEANGGMPSAVFLAGGGSRLSGLKEGIVEHLKIDPKRVAIAGNNFKINAFSEEYDLNNPEYTTPLGIVISAGLNMINDSFRVILNDRPAKLFRSGTFSVMDILMMNGYNYQDMIGRSGQNLVVQVNGKRQMFYGEKAEPSVLRLNGKEAQLSDQVNPGDKIEFIPASLGKNAFAQLSDIVQITKEKRVFLNGQEVEGNLPLKSGDAIVVEILEPDPVEDDVADEWELESIQPLKENDLESQTMKPEEQEESLPADSVAEVREEEDVFVQQQPEPAALLSQTQAIAKKDTTQESMEPDYDQPPYLSMETKVKCCFTEPGQCYEEETKLDTETAEEAEAKIYRLRPSRESFQAELRDVVPLENRRKPDFGHGHQSMAEKGEYRQQEVQKPETKVETEGKITFQLNGRPLVLSLKPDGKRYRLMDLLEYSSLDFKKITGPVVLEVNGQNGYFQQELKQGDHIKIYEKD